MDRCPSELWTRIFGLACMEAMDGGLTGCSIARVSRYFHEAVLPVQLYSVALSETKKMSAFADLLEQREPAHRRVRHLDLSGGYSIMPVIPRPVSHDANIAVDDLNVDDILSRILTTVAPHLLTLASTRPHRMITAQNTLDITFPRLTKLTMSGGLFYPAPRTSATDDCFPSLQYLNIEPSSIIPLYTSHAPRLTHLQLSEWGSFDIELRQSLESFLSGSADSDGAGESPFPSTIQKITIARNSMQVFGPPGTGRSYTASVQLALLLADKNHKLGYA